MCAPHNTCVPFSSRATNRIWGRRWNRKCRTYRLAHSDRQHAAAELSKESHHQNSVNESVGRARKNRKSDDDEKLTPKQSYATPRDEFVALWKERFSETPEFRVLDSIELAVRANGYELPAYIEVVRPHLKNNIKNAAGFLTDFARRLSSKLQKVAEPEPVGADGRYPRCNGLGRPLADSSMYCACEMGVDMKRSDRWSATKQ
jgi:hypothetical protein